MSDEESETESADDLTPPPSIPKYIAEPLQKQDVSTLRRIIAYGEQLAGLTPDNPMMTDEFDVEAITAGDIIRHSSDKSTVKSNEGQVVRVLGDEAIEIWDEDGKIQTIRSESVTAVSKHTVQQSTKQELRERAGTDVGERDEEE